MATSLRMTATRANLGCWPHAQRCLQKAAEGGLPQSAVTAAMFLTLDRSISRAHSLANLDAERNCDPYLAVWTALKVSMRILACPGSFLSGSSLPPPAQSEIGSTGKCAIQRCASLSSETPRA